MTTVDSLSETEREALLDDLLIRSIEKLDSIIALRNDLNRYMETGMIDLARARYATGGPRSAISSLSFNLGHMEATKRVSVSSEEHSSAEFPDDVTRFHLEAALNTSNKSTGKKSATEKCDNDRPTDHVNKDRGDKGGAQLRKRQVPSMKGDASIDRDSLECSDAARSSLESTATSSEEADQLNGNTARESSISGYSSERRESNSSSSSENKPKDVHRSNDPLRWFGVLVPSSLRTSKECFDRALEVLTEVATQQNELAHLLDTYQRLHKCERQTDNHNVDIQKLSLC